MKNDSRLPKHCPRCRGHLYRDFDGATCLNCGRTVMLPIPEIGKVWAEAHWQGNERLDHLEQQVRGVRLGRRDEK